MGIEKFDPISPPKRLKSATELRKLAYKYKKLVIPAITTKKEKEVEEIEK